MGNCFLPQWFGLVGCVIAGSMTIEQIPSPDPAPRKKYVRAVGPRLRVLLWFIFASVAVLAANSLYLGAITLLEWAKSDPNSTYQNWFYMVMYGSHLGLGLLLVLPVIIFGALHIRNAYNRPNRPVFVSSSHQLKKP